MTDFDVVIVGAGIAGASLAAELGDEKSVLLIEAEAQPGYHATGRSAAFWTESYGGQGVQPLTTASGPFLANPPKDFSDGPLMVNRGALHIGRDADRQHSERMVADFGTSAVTVAQIDAARIAAYVPGVRPDWHLGLWEPECCDIDVAALHGAYLRKAKRSGVRLVCGARLTRAHFARGHWQIEAGGHHYSAKMLLNAAGAWADDVAKIAAVERIGITPYRRTVLQLAVEPPAPNDLPLVMALDGSFYFKPHTGKIWLSPHDETLSPACDAAPAEIDVAIAIERFEAVVDWRITKLEHKWAGLRSFAPDRLPVIGADASNPSFFWFAGQGGFGVQTAPAAAKLAASLLCEDIHAPANINGNLYLPARLR